MLTEIESLLDQMNRDHAIKGAVVTGLTDILLGLTKTRLATLAALYQVAGRSKMNKEQLADAVLTQIEAPDKLSSILLAAREEEWTLFNRLLHEPAVQDHAFSYEQYVYFLDRGLVFAFYDGEGLALVLPDEVKAAVNRLDQSELKQQRERYELVYDYVSALTHLYGAYEPQRLLDIFNEQNADRPLDREELEQCLQVFAQREQDFAQEAKYIAAAALLEDGTERLDGLLEQTAGKPVYLPEKEQLLKYKDAYYYEETSEFEMLRNLVYPELSGDRQQVEALLQDIRLACAEGKSAQEAARQFERHSIEFETLDQAQRAALLIEAAAQHIRTWSNAGYTPAEVSKRSGQVVRAVHTTHYFPNKKQQAVVTKVGRNEPCPCGSGLKYKKCCGK